MDKKMTDYMNRIIPVVGNHLRGKRMAFINLQFTHLVAEAFARCGVNDFLFIDSSFVVEGSQMYMSYGVNYLRKSCAQAVQDVFMQHNGFETEWSFVCKPSATFEQLKSLSPDIIVAAGTVGECKDYVSMARSLMIPAVVFTFFKGKQVMCLISIIDVKYGLDYSVLDEPVEDLSGEPERLDFLEGSDLAANFSKAVLLMNTPFGREDIWEIVYTEQRNNILRGNDSWPWWILYGSRKSSDSMLQLISEDSSRHIITPSTDERLMIIGLGTASLLAAESINFYRKLLLVDYKDFTIYNPVRQLASTSDIGKGKAFAVQQILADRLPGVLSATSLTAEEGFVRTFRKQDFEITATSLQLKGCDRSSIDRFENILDYFRPTVVVVGMGQTRDDNYVATKILRGRGLRHVVPAAFPLATHYKHIVVDGSNGPCYSCLQGRLVVDAYGGPELTEEQREMFYGSGSYEEYTQPATIMETWPSVHSALRLCVQLSVGEREQWFRNCVDNNQLCFVGASIRIRRDDSYLYGVRLPGQVVVYSTDEILDLAVTDVCPDCGRKYSRC
ncbi:MAG: hypothetical protein V1645_04420 [archaeon]